MPHLKIRSSGQSVPVQGEVVTIGCGPMCTVKVQGQKVANRHCRLVRQGVGYVLENLDPEGGTTVNGRRVNRQPLQNGDRIRVGTAELLYGVDSALETSLSSLLSPEQAPARGPAPAARRVTPARGVRPPTGRMTPARGVRPATRRTPRQEGEGGEEENAHAQEQERKRKADADKMKIYVGAGAAVVLLLIVIVAAGGGGGGPSGGRPSVDDESDLTRQINMVVAQQNAGNAQGALDILSQILSDSRFRRSERYASCQSMAKALRDQIQRERESVERTAAFKLKFEAAMSDQTAMKRANELHQECSGLIAAYGNTSSGKELYDIRERLDRMRATEGQGKWQDEYNSRKEYIRVRYADKGNWHGAINDWRQFGEVSQDPVFHSRIDQEVAGINKLAREEAERIAADAASTDRIEAEMPRFQGTDGQAVLRGKLRALGK